ncbi:MAG TPA: DUF302 domain-containing protein [Candidatus Dormibacteraeota bacterium]
MAERGPLPAGVVTKLSPRSVDETVSRLEELLAARALTLFAVIDHGGLAEQAGLTLRATKLVVFGSPQAGTPLMVAEPLVALDLPLKLLVWDDGGQTKVSYLAPSTLAGRYGLGEDMAARIAGIDLISDALVT